MRIRDILRVKGSDVATISPDETVATLIEMLAQRRIGAMVVSSDGEHVVGIVSERDIVRALVRGPEVLGQKVSELMTAEVVTCEPDEELEQMVQTMTSKRFRHVPVMVEGSLSGIVSIGDIVKSRLDELQHERDHLQSYINS
jgi:CBS domain-containing protein